MEKTRSLNEVIINNDQPRDTHNLNEVMTKRFRLYRGHKVLVKDSYDLGSLQEAFNSAGPGVEIVDGDTGEVVQSK